MEYDPPSLREFLKRPENRHLKRILNSDPEHNAKALELMRSADNTSLVAFGEFAQVARSRGWTEDELVNEFRGKIEDPRDFFKRIFQGKHADAIIPYRSVLNLYYTMIGKADKGERACDCGCGLEVFGRKRYASEACKQRAYRQRLGPPPDAILTT